MNSTTLDISDLIESLDFYSYMLAREHDYYYTLKESERRDILDCVEDINKHSNLYWITEDEQAMLDFLVVSLNREED